MARNSRKRRERFLQAAEGYLDLNMPQHALVELSRLDPAEDRCDFAWHRLQGEALRALENYEAALVHYRQAHALREDDLRTLMGMAWCYKRVQQLPRAIVSMRRAYRRYPKNPVILYNLSCYYSLAGEKQQALSWLGRALRLERNLVHLIPEESDFDCLRLDPDFQQMIAIVKAPTKA